MSFKSSRHPPRLLDRVPNCSDALCSSCNENILAFFYRDRCQPTFVRYEDIREKSAAGCRICQLIAEFWASSDYSHDDMEVGWKELTIGYPGLGLRLWRSQYKEMIADIKFSAEVPWRYESQPTSMLIGAIEINRSDVRIFPEGPKIGHSTKGNSGSTEVMEMLKSWDSYCRSNHSCSLKSNLHQLPTRVIDVGPPDGSHDPRLYIPSGKTGVYLTLSHCWGGHLTTKLLLSNICAYEKAIERTLPATFRDAVSVTRQLGFRYLWIDALCIIQDSDEDWELEVSKMASVYKNCRLMLSATDSTNGDGGLFRDRNDDVLFEIPDQLSRSCGFPKGAYAHRTRDWFLKAAWNGALSQRGWALQEAILAPVVIHFCSQQVFWECRQMQISEGGEFTTVELAKSFAPSRAHRLIPEPGAESSPEKYEFWYNIIEEFSHRKLTVPTDVLPAVTGLAQESAVTLDDVYVNGLWMSDLAKGILWAARGNTRSSSKRKAPACRTIQSAMHAPSWSWASVEGCVTWPFDNNRTNGPSCQYLFEILGLEPPVNISTYMASHSALVVRGVIKKCLHLIVADHVTRSIQFQDCKEPSAFDFRIYQDRVYAEVDLSEISYCYLLQAAETPNAKLQRCLMLEPIQTEGKVFRRIGVCETMKSWAQAFFGSTEPVEIRIC